MKLDGVCLRMSLTYRSIMCIQVTDHRWSDQFKYGVEQSIGYFIDSGKWTHTFEQSSAIAY